MGKNKIYDIYTYIWKFIDFKNKWILFLLFILDLLLLGVSLVPPFLILYIFDEVLVNLSQAYLLKLIIFTIGFFIVNYFLEILSSKTRLKFNKSLEFAATNKMIKNILTTDLQVIRNFDEGDLLSRAKYDVTNIITKSINLIIGVPLNILLLFTLIIIMFKFNAALTLLAVILFALELSYTAFASRKYEKIMFYAKSYDGENLSLIKQIIQRLLFLKINKLLDYEANRFNNHNEIFLDKKTNLQYYQLRNSALLNFISSIRTILIIILGAYLISESIITIGILLAFNQLVNRTSQPLGLLYNVPFTYKDILTSFNRIDNLTHVKDISSSVSNGEGMYALECRNLTFGYNKSKIISNFDLKVEKSSKVSIIGKSGSGKSTLCKLIAGIYNFEGDISTSHVKSFGAMLDECSLIPGTVEENLTYGLGIDKISKENIRDVLLKVLLNDRFNPEDYIEKNILSRGEQQRLELARIMIQKPDLIILDEPTSALDVDVEEIVWNNFIDTCKDSTLIYTTHRKSIIKDNHLVINMADLNRTSMRLEGVHS